MSAKKSSFNRRISKTLKDARAALMSQSRAALVARLNRLEAALRGEAEVVEVEVKAHWVKRHQRGPYTRLVVVLPEKRAVGKRRR